MKAFLGKFLKFISFFCLIIVIFYTIVLLFFPLTDKVTGLTVGASERFKLFIYYLISFGSVSLIFRLIGNALLRNKTISVKPKIKSKSKTAVKSKVIATDNSVESLKLQSKAMSKEFMNADINDAEIRGILENIESLVFDILPTVQKGEENTLIRLNGLILEPLVKIVDMYKKFELYPSSPQSMLNRKKTIETLREAEGALRKMLEQELVEDSVALEIQLDMLNELISSNEIEDIKNYM